MRTTAAIVGIFMLMASLVAGTASFAADTPKTDRSKGFTVEDLWRGLKSAEENIEKEIPKIGSAIGNAFKTITSKDSGKQSAHTPEKEKK